MSKIHFDREGRARCGTRARSPRLVTDDSAVTCRSCLNLIDGTWAVGIRWGDVEPCGTPAAYRRELRQGGPVHEECRRAANRDATDRRRARKRRKQNVEVLAA